MQASFTAVIDGQRSFFVPFLGREEGDTHDLLGSLEARFRRPDSSQSSDDYQATLIAGFAEVLGIPPVTVEVVSGPMTTAWRNT